MLTKIRNSFLGFIYTKILKPLFFRFDPENVHNRLVRTGELLGKTALGQSLVRGLFFYKHPALEQKILGITFRNPVGLAAGFDKNAELTQILPSIGFGFEEVGSITAKKCEGNPKPRLWRLKESKGLVVHYGLKNDGCEAVSSRLSHLAFSNVIGTSVAMTNCRENI